MKSTKRKRPPYDPDFEDVAPRLASLRLRSRKQPRVAPVDEIVPESDCKPERERPSGTWRPIKQRLRDALGQLRALLFIHVEDERACLRLRGFLQFHHRQKRSLPVLLQDLNEYLPESKTDELEPLEISRVLSALLTHVLCEDVTQYRPLLEKLPDESQEAMNRILGEEYTREMSSENSLQELPNFKSWFSVRARKPQVKIERSLSEFQPVQKWSVDQELHDAKCDAFARYAASVLEMNAVKARLKKLKDERKKKEKWKPYTRVCVLRPCPTHRAPLLDKKQRVERQAETDRLTHSLLFLPQYQQPPSTQAPRLAIALTSSSPSHTIVVPRHPPLSRSTPGQRSSRSVLRLRQVPGRYKTSEKRAFDQVVQEVEKEEAPLDVEKELMLLQTRKYRLFPTNEQEKTLKRYMGTCRWTYNQAVAHFRKTDEFQAEHLRDLYLTKTSKKTREYPEGMSPLPEWVFDTPKNLRYNVMRMFQTNVNSALSNNINGNISKFKIGFSSRKRTPFFTMSEDGKAASIKKKTAEKQSSYFLSISCLKDIRVKMDSHVEISKEIDILNSNGFWYVAIPEYVQPAPLDNRGKCIALDPGIKAFVTGVDLEGNVLEFGRDTKKHLNKLRERRNEAQSVISNFKDLPIKSTYWQYRTYARAKRTFSSCVAKMKNCVKELHYQTSAYLTKDYGTILLLIFQTKDMVKKSSAKNHRFNDGMLSLNHFQFRKLLKTKCEVRGKSLVVCSEMYTSRTCGRCSRLHLKLGSNDVFSCQHCEYTAGRDENAAFNILRFVSAGSLQIYPLD